MTWLSPDARAELCSPCDGPLSLDDLQYGQFFTLIRRILSSSACSMAAVFQNPELLILPCASKKYPAIPAARSAAAMSAPPIHTHADRASCFSGIFHLCAS
jgi:hypothetical protein